MLVKWQMDPCGNVTGQPVKMEYACIIAKHMQEWTGHEDPSCFIREAHYEDLAEFIPRRSWRDLEHGWTIRTRVDSWTFAHLYGWDCHTCFE